MHSKDFFFLIFDEAIYTEINSLETNNLVYFKVATISPSELWTEPLSHAAEATNHLGRGHGDYSGSYFCLQLYFCVQMLNKYQRKGSLFPL